MFKAKFIFSLVKKAFPASKFHLEGFSFLGLKRSSRLEVRIPEELALLLKYHSIELSAESGINTSVADILISSYQKCINEGLWIEE